METSHGSQKYEEADKYDAGTRKHDDADKRDDNRKYEEAERIVNGYMGWSAGAGLIPIPGLDLIGIGAVQLKMVGALSELYKIPFKKNRAKAFIGALLGSGGAVMATVPAASLIKFVPIVGPLASMFTEPAAAAAATYAVGRVFILHFESGGNFLDLDHEGMRKYYEEALSEARAEKKAPRTPARTPA